MGSYVSTPNAGQSLGGTRDQMRTNTDLLKASLAINHVDLGSANVGKHKWVEMPVQGSTPTTLAGEGTAYTRTANSVAASTESNLFYTPDATTNAYQLTRTITSKASEFGTFTNYPPGTANQDGGWTFLPGGLLVQYGTMLVTGGTTSVVYPVPFTTAVYSITFSIKSMNGIALSSETSTGFNALTSTSVGTRFYWMAIGK